MKLATVPLTEKLLGEIQLILAVVEDTSSVKNVRNGVPGDHNKASQVKSPKVYDTG